MVSRKILGAVVGIVLVIAALGATLYLTTPPKVQASIIIATTPGGTTNEYAIFYAIEKGIFKEEGLDVTTQDLAGGALSIKALIAGEVTTYSQTVGGALPAIEAGADIIGVTSVVKRFSMYIMVPKDSSIKEPKDLEGATIGVTRKGSATWGAARFAAGKYGLTKTTEIELGGAASIMSALEAGQVKAMVMWSPGYFTALDKGHRVVVDIGDFEPILAWFTKSYSEKNPAVVSAYVRALLKAHNAVVKDKAGVFQIIKKRFPDQSDQVISRSIDEAIQIYSLNGKFDEQAINRSFDYLLSAGLLKDRIPISKFTTTKYLS